LIDNINIDPLQKKPKKSSFIEDVLLQTGLTLVSSGTLSKRPASSCNICGKVMVNEMLRWKSHARHCNKGISNIKDMSAIKNPTPLVLTLNAAAETARQKIVDQYVITYWLYQQKMPFTTGVKLQEV
jgi:hypothetical protein